MKVVFCKLFLVSASLGVGLVSAVVNPGDETARSYSHDEFHLNGVDDEFASWTMDGSILGNDDTGGMEIAMTRHLIAKAKAVSFYAMGDVPYSITESRLFPEQIRKLSSSSGSFAIHLGDMKQQTKQCTEPFYKNVSAVLRNASLPIFIVPGDNDWYDCENDKEALNFWKKHFNKLSNSWNKPFTVTYQGIRAENFAMVYKNVLFIGVHTIHPHGGSIKNRTEWNTLVKQDTTWFKKQIASKGSLVGAVVIFTHCFPNKSQFATLNTAIVDAAKSMEKPFLFIQGDGHKWSLSRRFGVDNILCVVVDQGGIADPVLVTVDPTNGSTTPFKFVRRKLSAVV